MAERQRRAHDLVVGQDAFVAVDDGRTGAAIARAGVDQRLKDSLPGLHHIERGDVLARSSSDASDSQMTPPQTAGMARSVVMTAT